MIHCIFVVKEEDNHVTLESNQSRKTGKNFAFVPISIYIIYKLTYFYDLYASCFSCFVFSLRTNIVVLFQERADSHFYKFSSFFVLYSTSNQGVIFSFFLSIVSNLNVIFFHYFFVYLFVK